MKPPSHPQSPVAQRYVLITAARNEAALIGQTIDSITRQSILPVKWVIVSDNSTDDTDNIITQYAARYPFIQLLKKRDEGKRDFASKVFALNTAYAELKDVKYDFIGILDSDITLPEDYYQRIMERFNKNLRLGIAGGSRVDEINGKWVPFKKQPHSVSGAVHFLRRKCYQDVGGYPPLPYGSEDAYAEVMARKLGWQVQAFPELTIYHHRKTGEAAFGNWRYHINLAKSHYHLGYDPLYFWVTVVYRMFQKPYVIGGLLRAIGYGYSFFTESQSVVSKEIKMFIKREQRTRLYNMLKIIDSKHLRSLSC